MILIGVDPAFRRDGFRACVVDYTDRTVRFLSFDSVLHWDRWLRSDDAPAPDINRVVVVVENSNLQNSNFDKKGNVDEVQKKGRNVGKNQAVSELAVSAAIDRYGKRYVIAKSPLEKGGKWNLQQAEAVARQERLSLPKRPNEDERDAFKLALMGKNELKYATH